MLGPSLLAIGSFLLLTWAIASPINLLRPSERRRPTRSFSCGSYGRQPGTGERDVEKTRISSALNSKALKRRAEAASGDQGNLGPFNFTDPYISSLISFSQRYETKVVPITFHVVYANKTAEGGYLRSSSINAQIKVLNDAFASTGFQFVLKKLQYTLNKKWFEGVGTNADDGASNKLDLAMRKELHTGTASDLNVYTVGTIKSEKTASNLGFASFPFWYEQDPEGDGVVIQHYTLPDTGFEGDFDAGITLVHETGHWLGLHHTFSQPEGCDEKYGDQVRDTPTETSAAWPTVEDPMVGRDTCPDNIGLDPISNFMDYAPDTLSTSFTIGQAARMIAMTELFRDL